MTCIVGIETNEGCLVAADSYVGMGSYVGILQTPKVFRVGPLLIGGTGYLRPVQLIKHHLKVPGDLDGDGFHAMLPEQFRDIMSRHGAVHSDEGGREDCDAGFVIAFRGKLYLMDSGFDLLSLDRHYVCAGSGEAFAIGCLYGQPPPSTLAEAEKQARLALAAATEHTSVRPPFKFMIQRKPHGVG